MARPRALTKAHLSLLTLSYINHATSIHTETLFSKCPLNYNVLRSRIQPIHNRLHLTGHQYIICHHNSNHSSLNFICTTTNSDIHGPNERIGSDAMPLFVLLPCHLSGRSTGGGIPSQLAPPQRYVLIRRARCVVARTW